MALRPGLRMIDPGSMPIDKMPVDKLKEVVPGETPLGKMLAMLPDSSLQAEPAVPPPNDGLEQLIDLLGVTGSSGSDLL